MKCFGVITTLRIAIMYDVMNWNCLDYWTLIIIPGTYLSQVWYLKHYFPFTSVWWQHRMYVFPPLTENWCIQLRQYTSRDRQYSANVGYVCRTLILQNGHRVQKGLVKLNDPLGTPGLTNIQDQILCITRFADGRAPGSMEYWHSLRIFFLLRYWFRSPFGWVTSL